MSDKLCNRTNIAFLSKETGELVRARCNAYSCPVCGKKKMWKLFNAVMKAVESWQHLNMWTLTVNHKLITEDDGRSLIQHAWKVFIKEIRRAKSLSEKQRNLPFLRVWERHKDGYFHCHVLTNTYVDYAFLRNLWLNCLRESATKLNVGIPDDVSSIGSINLKSLGKQEGRTAARYITKYVTKQLEDIKRNQKDFGKRRYSTSRNIILFEQKKSDGSWLVVKLYECDFESEHLLVDVLTSHCIIAHEDRVNPPPNTPETVKLTRSDIEKQVEASESIHYSHLREQFSLDLPSETSYNHLCD